ncbi:MAG: peptidoglycan-binding domain-containing protein [Methylococcales bacterium]
MKSFQKQYGLKPDGEVGPITEQTISSKGASPPPAVKQLPCSPTKAETLIAILNKHRGNIPLHILLGWMEIESGRQIGSITSLCERGYSQIKPDEAQDRGIKNHQLLSYDEDHSVQGGIKLINYFIARTNLLVTKYGLPNQGDVYWRVVKLHHWIPSGPEKMLADMQAHGVKPSSWAVITSYALNPSNRDRLTQKIKRDPKQGIDNADEMLKQAKAWLKRLQANKSLSKESEVSAYEFACEGFFENNDKQEFERRVIPSAPALLKCEKTSPGETLCVRIDLEIKDAQGKVYKKPGKPPTLEPFKVQPMTGIFIPQAYVPQKEVDIVLYLHGHKTDFPGNGAAIHDYWKGSRFPFFALREEVNDSGQNVIFVAPTLGPLSQAGNLTTAKGFDGFLTKVLAALNKYFVSKQSWPEVQGIGKIFLAAHSGGGSPMLRIAELKGSSNTSKIAECWGFDSMYGDIEKRWADWAKSHQNSKLFAYYYNTEGHSTTLEKISKGRNLRNVCVHGWEEKDFADWARSHPALKKSNAGPHYWVPIVSLKERIQNAPCRAKRISSLSRSRTRQTEVDLRFPSHRGITSLQAAKPRFAVRNYEVDTNVRYPLTDNAVDLSDKI